jgi:hypothetical protein
MDSKCVFEKKNLIIYKKKEIQKKFKHFNKNWQILVPDGCLLALKK